MNKLRVLLMYGGESSEHEVSIASAHNVYAALDEDKYDVYLCYIDRSGKWWLLHDWRDNLDAHGGAQLVVAPGTKSIISIPGNTVLRPDVMLPILHGKHGEDGTVQGLAELLHIPIVGSDTVASAITIDKILTKQVLASVGIVSADYETYRKGEEPLDYNRLVDHLGLPLFVKPSRAGSSVGVTKVHTIEAIDPAIQEALKHDTHVLIERALNGRELETAVLGNPPHHEVSGVGEIIPGADFYDYNDKYAADSRSVVSDHADLPADIEARIRETSRRVYDVLGCRGLARVDYILEGDTPYVLEVNSMPGFTNISMYPKLWHAAGITYPALIDKLITLALE